MKKNLNCPICGSSKTEKYKVTAEYELTKCDNCSFIWDNNPPSNYKDQYVEKYFRNDDPKGGYANYFEGMAVNRKTFKERISRLEDRLGRKGKLMDIGCALGDCLLVAQELGWKDVEGIELSDYAYKFAKRERKLKVNKGTTESVKLPSNRYDAVLMQDVIEHIPDTVSELKRIHKIMKKGGIALFITPDIGGFWHWLLKNNWYHYKPGEHISYFNPRSMGTALEKAGFKDIEVRKTYHIMSMEYILNRLKVYSPELFGGLLLIVRRTKLKNFAFRVFAGELEAWARK